MPFTFQDISFKSEIDLGCGLRMRRRFRSLFFWHGPTEFVHGLSRLKHVGRFGPAGFGYNGRDFGQSGGMSGLPPLDARADRKSSQDKSDEPNFVPGHGQEGCIGENIARWVPDIESPVQAVLFHIGQADFRRARATRDATVRRTCPRRSLR